MVEEDVKIVTEVGKWEKKEKRMRQSIESSEVEEILGEA